MKNRIISTKLLALSLSIALLAVCLCALLVACNPDTTPPLQFPNEYTVTFETNGGSKVDSKPCSSISEAPLTQKDSYEFDGWFENADLSDESRVIFPYTVTEDITLYAKWTPNKYSANITIHGGGKIADSNNNEWDRFSFMLAHGSEHTFSAKANNGYIFDGWYNDDTKISNELTLTFTMPADDVSYTAKFNLVQLPTALSDSGECSFTAVDNIVHLTAKPYLGYEFVGWYEISDDNSNDYKVTLLSDKLDFEFNGIGHSGTIRPEWRKLPEIEDYVFTSNFAECVITGSNDHDKSSYIIPDYVTEIGKNAFQYCRQFSQIEIPSSVKTIGDSAFRYCGKLTQIKFNEKLTAIGDYAFYDAGLTSVKLPDSVISIGNSAFNCLESIYIGKSLVSVGLNAFGDETVPNITVSEQNPNFSTYENVLYDKNKTKFIYVPSAMEVLKVADGMTQIPDEQFANRPEELIPYKFKQIELPESVVKIGISAFVACQSLTTVIINGLAEIGASACDGCKQLHEVTAVQGVISIDRYAFAHCPSLEKLTIPYIAKTVNSNAFEGTEYLTTATLPASIFEEISPRLLLNATITSGIITSSTLFSSRNTLTSLTVLEDVEEIGQSSFKDCVLLRDVSLPEGLTTIANRTFQGCSFLTEITIPDSVETIGNYAFDGCSFLKTVVLGENVKTVKGYAFSNCTNLKNLTFGSKLTEICDEAFYKSEAIKNVYISDLSAWCQDVKFGDSPLKYHATLYVDGSSTWTIPTDISKISAYAFTGCTNIEKLIIPSNVKSIETSAFRDCRYMTEVVVHAGLTSLSISAFGDCEYLTDITFPDGITTVSSSVFRGSTNITNATVPTNLITKIPADSLTSLKIVGSGEIADNATYSLTPYANLETIEVCDGITRIGYDAFTGCPSVFKITIAHSVTEISKNAFLRCYSLETVVYEGTSEEWAALYSGEQDFDIICTADEEQE